MLEYDDSAFYYFSISVLSFLLFPATISMLYTLYTGVVKVENFTGQCLCNWCSTLIRAKKRESRASVFNKAFYIKLIIAAFLISFMVASWPTLRIANGSKDWRASMDMTISKFLIQRYQKKAAIMSLM